MEPENFQPDVIQETSNLNKVTPLSKYLAMALFVIMPFLGGWIGYEWAPGKIVEVEKIVLREISNNEITEQKLEAGTPEYRYRKVLGIRNDSEHENWGIGKNGVYYLTNSFPSTNDSDILLTDIDSDSVKFYGGNYLIDKNGAYWFDSSERILKNFDHNTNPDNFTVLSYGVARDAVQLFYRENKIQLPLELNSIELLGSIGGWDNPELIFKDSKQVLLWNVETATNTVRDDIDAASFKHVGACGGYPASNYYVDANNVFVGNLSDLEKLSNIDVASFTYLGTMDGYVDHSFPDGIAYDKNSIYLGCGNILNGLKPSENMGLHRADSLVIFGNDFGTYDYYDLIDLLE